MVRKAIYGPVATTVQCRWLSYLLLLLLSLSKIGRKFISNNRPCYVDQVEKSLLFRREGADIHSDVSISLAQAVLGGRLTTPGIYEDIQLSVSMLSTMDDIQPPV